MRIKNLDLVVAIGIVVINIAWTRIPNHPVVLGILLVLPLLFVFPGYMLTEILFRGRSLSRLRASSNTQNLPQSASGQRQPVEIADQIVLSLGLSLAIDILVGFGLNFLTIGLQASSWALMLGLVTTVFTLLTALLRRKDDASIAVGPKIRFTLANGLLLGLSIGIIAISIWLAFIRPLDPQPSFTQLWMLPEKNSTCSVSIGVQNFETTPVTYHLVMTVNDARANDWPSIALSPQQKWSQSVVVAPGNASNLHIQVQLYRTDKPDTVYRSAHISFHVTTSKNTGQTQNQCKLGT